MKNEGKLEKGKQQELDLPEVKVHEWADIGVKLADKLVLVDHEPKDLLTRDYALSQLVLHFVHKESKELMRVSNIRLADHVGCREKQLIADVQIANKDIIDPALKEEMSQAAISFIVTAVIQHSDKILKQGNNAVDNSKQ